jgi:hypothetical protein
LEKLTMKNMLSRYLMWFICVGALMPMQPSWAAGASITDPAGDAVEGGTVTDFLALAVTESGATLTFRLDFAEIGLAQGTVLLDTDGNRRTHGPAGCLTEAQIVFMTFGLGGAMASFEASSVSSTLNCWIAGTSLYIEMPISLLPGGTTNLEVAAVAGTSDLGANRDRVPDEGFLKLSTGEIHLDTCGTDLNPLSQLTDPAGDAPEPVDLKGVEMQRVGEHLVVRCHYHHSINPAEIYGYLTGTVYFDLDHDILTGFMNTGEVFPTFGIDAHLSYQIGHLPMGGDVSVELTQNDPVNSQILIGSLASDSTYQIEGNYIEISVPLGLFLPITNSSIARLECFDISGHYDRFPNQGGLIIGSGALRPFNSLQTGEVSVTDPGSDSVGLDNDNFIKMSAGHCQEGILLTVEYSRLQVTGQATTNLHLDTDRNAETGEATYNYFHTTKLGVEKTILVRWDLDWGGLEVLLISGTTGENLGELLPLVGLNFATNKAYITIPYRLLNSRNVNIYAKTLSGGVIPVFEDEIPDTGVLSVSTPTPKGVPFWLDLLLGD